jgi:hypothetical protein
LTPGLSCATTPPFLFYTSCSTPPAHASCSSPLVPPVPHLMCHTLCATLAVPHPCFPAFVEQVAAAAEALVEIATVLGPPMLVPLTPKLTSLAVALLSRQHPCLADPEDDNDAPDDDAEHDGGLWEAVSDLLVTICPSTRPVHAPNSHPISAPSTGERPARHDAQGARRALARALRHTI